MLKVIVNDLHYEIYWKYEVKTIEPYPGKVSTQDITTCVLVRGPNEAKVTIKRYFKDPASKDYARRHSLAEILKKLMFIRVERIIIWEAYNKMSPIKETVHIPKKLLQEMLIDAATCGPEVIKQILGHKSIQS